MEEGTSPDAPCPPRAPRAGGPVHSPQLPPAALLRADPPSGMAGSVSSPRPHFPIQDIWVASTERRLICPLIPQPGAARGLSRGRVRTARGLPPHLPPPDNERGASTKVPLCPTAPSCRAPTPGHPAQTRHGAAPAPAASPGTGTSVTGARHGPRRGAGGGHSAVPPPRPSRPLREELQPGVPAAPSGSCQVGLVFPEQKNVQ